MEQIVEWSVKWDVMTQLTVLWRHPNEDWLTKLIDFIYTAYTSLSLPIESQKVDAVSIHMQELDKYALYS